MYNIFKKWAEHDVDLAQIKKFGDVYFVDRESGSDAYSGLKPKEAKLTLNAAVALCIANHNDSIIFKGRTTSGQMLTATQTIDKSGVHLIGSGLFYGSAAFAEATYVGYHTPAATGGLGSPPGLLVEGNGCEIAGIKFYNPDATKIQTELQVHADFSSGGRGTGVSIHDCFFQGQNGGTADRTRGIELIGSEAAQLYRNQFYCCEYGIYFRSASYHYTQGCTIKDQLIYGAKYGLYFDVDVADNILEDILIAQKGNTGYAITRGVQLGTNTYGNTFRRVDVGHATKSTAFAPAGNTNYWIDCHYMDTTGGTLYDGS